MSIEPKYEKVANSVRTKLGVTQAVIECKLPVNDSNQVLKILCASAKSYISNTEATLKEVNFSGNVNFQVIYENEEKIAEALDYTAEFKDKFVSDEITMSMLPIVTSSVVDVNTTTNNNEVKVVAIVEIYVDAIESCDVNVLVDASGENVFTKQETNTFSEFLGVLSNKFEMGYDIEIKDNILKILEVSLSPYIESVTPKDKVAEVVGGANVDICYLTNGETPLLRSYQTCVQVTEEVALDGLNEDSCLQSDLGINYSLIKVTTNIDADSAIVNLNIPYDYKGYAFNFYEKDVVTDIFSTSNNLNLTTASINSIVCGGNLTDTNKVSGNVVIEDNFIDEVLGTCCNTVTLASSFIENGTITLEGVASTTVIYLNKETSSIYSALVEMPFSIMQNMDNITSEYTPIINLSLGDVSCRLKRGSEVEVNATLFVYVNFYSDKTDAVISQIEIADERTEENSVLTIYVVKPNETIWDIAKDQNVNPDSLLNQNPSIELPLVGGEKLVIYRQKEVLF